MKKTIRKLLNSIRGVQSIDKLKKRGLKIGKNVTIMGDVIIDPSHCWHIKIGDDVILAPRVHILAHDASTKLFLNHTRVANVTIGNKVFVGAGTIILPNVEIGNNVIVGAGSVVKQNIPSNSVAVGVPAKIICSLDEYLQKQKEQMLEKNTFDELFTLRNPNFSEQHKNKMLKASNNYKQIFVE